MPKFASLARKYAPCILVAFLSLGLQRSVFAQASSASLTVGIADTTGAVIPDAGVVIRNIDTNQEQRSVSGKTGSASFSFLKPGHYALTVSKDKFADIAVDNIVLNVGDERQLQLVLKVGAATQMVNVDGSGATINTTDASVSTVVDRKFVANMPLNGRSFQDLISMTPGVVTASPQTATPGQISQIGGSGDFSVNGQRTESNYYTVDGVSANVGAGSGYGTPQAGEAGGVSAGTAFGTTQSLASVDELQEFRVTSSTYSAEFGHGPGGQFGLLTRSGTKAFHGTAFDYLRNNFFDANDWFNDHYGKPEPALRQNDFGGTFGGPVWLPRLYDGRQRTFFFGSYEGLRITQPQAATIQYVPDSFMRQEAAAAIQPILNAYPIQNGLDYGTAASPSLAQFTESYSLPGHVNSTSIRFDHTFFPKLSSFFRFSNTSSSTAARSQSVITSLKFNTRTYTLGATSPLFQTLINEFRLGFSHSDASNAGLIDGFGGAQPINLAGVMGAGIYPHAIPEMYIAISGIENATLSDQNAQNLQSQWNATDSVSITSGKHQIKVGVDYRWIRSPETPASPLALAYYTSASAVLSNAALEGAVIVKEAAVPIFQQFAAYAQDEWRLSSSIGLSAGLRWELNPPPSAESGNTPYTVLGNVGNPSSLQLAPRGTPIWNTAKYNFAPRLGAAWTAHATPGWETVFRTGGGVYFDTSNEVATEGYSGIGYTATGIYLSHFSLPFSTAQLAITPSVVAPYTSAIAYVFPAHMQAPYTLQWSLSLEQAFGHSQTVTVSYIGANGRRLVGLQELSVNARNPNFGSVDYFANGITSNYQALQLKFQRSVTKGVHALASYTWSHSLDYGSNDLALPLERGNSDFDVRNNLQAGVTWDLPKTTFNSYGDAILRDWGIDARALVRTAFPITLGGNQETDPATGSIYFSGLNYDSSKPIYLYGAQYIGGKAINGGANNKVNPAFTVPPATNPVGNAPRNLVRGFGLAQLNLAVRRQFPIYKETSLQFRAEAFNMFNRPNFGYVDPLITDATFGQPTAMLNGSLGTMAAQYQQGGARSMQFSLRVQF
jgi:Carboxypeptidase regulatory-like domain